MTQLKFNFSFGCLGNRTTGLGPRSNRLGPRTTGLGPRSELGYVHGLVRFEVGS